MFLKIYILMVLLVNGECGNENVDFKYVAKLNLCCVPFDSLSKWTV